MNTVRDPRAGIAQAQRAKRLRPLKSGVFPAVVHDSAALVANDSPVVSESAPGQLCNGERLRSGVRKATRLEAAAALSATADRLCLSDTDIGVAIDEPRQRVAEMKSGAKALTTDHLLLIARRLPVLFAVLSAELFGSGS